MRPQQRSQTQSQRCLARHTAPAPSGHLCHCLSWVHPRGHANVVLPTHTGIHPSIHSLTHSLIHLFTHSFIIHIHSFIQSLIHLFIRSLIHSFTHLFTHSFTHSFSHLLTHSLMLPMFNRLSLLERIPSLGTTGDTEVRKTGVLPLGAGVQTSHSCLPLLKAGALSTTAPQLPFSQPGARGRAL